jgi:integrase
MQNIENTKLEKKPLSSKAIEAMKPRDKTVSDSGENTGLRIKCGASGTKTFFYRYKSPISKKLVQIKIDNYPVVSLAEARVELQKLKSIRLSGRCPVTENKALKQERLNASSKGIAGECYIVEDVVELYLTQHIEDRMLKGKRVSGARKPKGQSDVRRTLHGDAVRVLGEKQASSVTRKDIINLITGVIKRGSNVQAGNVLRELSAAFDYAIVMDIFDDDFSNPCIPAKIALKRLGMRLTSQRGRRYLTDAELIKLLKWLPGSVFTPTQKNILRFTLWTGCRTGEVCQAEWRDVDLDKGTWHLRATKTDTERFVQLPTQAVAFLRQLQLTTGEYPFPSQKTGIPIQQKSLSEQAWHLRKTNRMVDLDHWVPHDLRRTVRTGLSRLKCRSEVAEAILGHSRKGIEGTYDLHDYEDECREWLQKWADHLDELLLKPTLS